jgi:hypothetical protein
MSRRVATACSSSTSARASSALTRRRVSSLRTPSWTTPECVALLVCAIAEGRLDRLVGRYLHAERDPVDELERRADEIIAEDLNVIRLRRK